MMNQPRLIVSTLGVTLVTVRIILAVVFLVLLFDAGERVGTAEIAKRQIGEHVFQTLEEASRRERPPMSEPQLQQLLGRGV